jgi:hypothetical protein
MLIVALFRQMIELGLEKHVLGNIKIWQHRTDVETIYIKASTNYR